MHNSVLEKSHYPPTITIHKSLNNLIFAVHQRRDRSSILPFNSTLAIIPFQRKTKTLLFYDMPITEQYRRLSIKFCEWKCNFHMTTYVSLLGRLDGLVDRWSVCHNFQTRGKLICHTPIGALVSEWCPRKVFVLACNYYNYHPHRKTVYAHFLFALYILFYLPFWKDFQQSSLQYFHPIIKCLNFFRLRLSAWKVHFVNHRQIHWQKYSPNNFTDKAWKEVILLLCILSLNTTIFKILYPALPWFVDKLPVRLLHFWFMGFWGLSSPKFSLRARSKAVL